MPTPGLCRVPRVEDAQPGDAPFAVARLSALSEALQEDKQGIGRFVMRRHNAARIGVCECACAPSMLAITHIFLRFSVNKESF
ncbi:MAG: hypothetical protein CBCREVIR_3427, partial [Candidatus Burkholderia crenata]